MTSRQDIITIGTIKAARARYGSGSAGRKAALVAVMTIKTESGCRVLANANVPASLAIEHDLLPWSSDGLGHDHASLGPYQQQTGTAWTVPSYLSTMGTPNGWGTPIELMTPSIAAGKFFHAMDAKGGLTGKSWEIAQRVQVSAFDGNPREANNYSRVYGGNYKGQRAAALVAIARLWVKAGPQKPSPPVPPPAPKPVSKPKPVAAAAYTTVRPGQTLSSIAAHYQVASWHTLVSLNSKRYPSLVARPDYIKAGWKLRVK